MLYSSTFEDFQEKDTYDKQKRIHDEGFKITTLFL